MKDQAAHMTKTESLTNFVVGLMFKHCSIA